MLSFHCFPCLGQSHGQRSANVFTVCYTSFPRGGLETGLELKSRLCCAALSRSVVSDSLQPHALQPLRLLCPRGFSRQEYWSELPCPPPGDLPKPRIEPRSPTLQEDSLPSEPPGKLQVQVEVSPNQASVTFGFMPIQGLVLSCPESWFPTPMSISIFYQTVNIRETGVVLILPQSTPSTVSKQHMSVQLLGIKLTIQ